MTLIRLLLLFSLALTLGCGGGANFESVSVEPPAAPPAAEQAKAILQEVANSGEVGSGTEALRPLFEEIKATDSAKGDALLSDLDALQSAGDPSARKAKANEMIGKL